jgi:hypothetical protein
MSDITHFISFSSSSSLSSCVLPSQHFFHPFMFRLFIPRFLLFLPPRLHPTRHHMPWRPPMLFSMHLVPRLSSPCCIPTMASSFDITSHPRLACVQLDNHYHHRSDPCLLLLGQRSYEPALASLPHMFESPPSILGRRSSGVDWGSFLPCDILPPPHRRLTIHRVDPHHHPSTHQSSRP